jgi:diguanylate cyclase (GGDEF)-like protein
MHCHIIKITCCILIFLTTLDLCAQTPVQLPERLVISNSASWIPYSFLDQRGNPRGILIDFWQAFAQKNGIEVEFKLRDWADSIAQIRSGDADIHGGLIETKPRTEYLEFFPRDILDIRTLAFIYEDIRIRDLAELEALTIGVVADSADEDFLRKNFPDLTLASFANSRMMVQAAVSGDIKVFVTDHPTGYYHLLILESLDRFETGPTLYVKPIRAATRQGDSAMLKTISLDAEQVTAQEIEQIYKKWLIPKEPLPSWVVPALTLSAGLVFLAMIGLHLLSLRRTIKIKTGELQTTVAKLAAANRDLYRLSRTDPLTGLPNRLAFFELAPREIHRAKRYDRSLSLVILDVDRFKQINDDCGHQVGDIALKHMTQRILEQLRPSDLFMRIGGEEFALVLPETQAQEAMHLTERVLKQVQQSPLEHQDERIALSFSAGVTEYTDDASLDRLIMHADKALYQSKAEGRGRVTLKSISKP